MGPRSVDRGNRVSSAKKAAQGRLRWGRDRSIAEMSADLVTAISVSKLRWGRDRSIAEIAPILTYSDFKDLRASLRAVLLQTSLQKISGARQITQPTHSLALDHP